MTAAVHAAFVIVSTAMLATFLFMAFLVFRIPLVIIVILGISLDT
jgi:hypothetical protein